MNDAREDVFDDMVTESKRASGAKPRARTAKKAKTKPEEDDRERISGWFDKPLAKRLRYRATDEDCRMNDIIVKAVREYLARKK